MQNSGNTSSEHKQNGNKLLKQYKEDMNLTTNSCTFVEQRSSPIVFRQKPLNVIFRKGWPVVQRYEGEGSSPHVIDASHAIKLDIQDMALNDIRPLGLKIPHKPGQSAVYKKQNLIINRLNEVQAVIWQLNPDTAVIPEGPQYTDVTDSYLLLALSGNNIFDIAERLSTLDMMDPKLTCPVVLQGAFLHVPSQIVVVSREATDGLIFVACSRGYGHSFLSALFHALKSFDLRPAGEQALNKTLAALRD
jgi:hypothetical protein